MTKFTVKSCRVKLTIPSGSFPKIRFNSKQKLSIKVKYYNYTEIFILISNKHQITPMTKLIVPFIAVIFLFSANVAAQNNGNTVKNDTLKAPALCLNTDFAIGYAPKSPYHALKADFSVNNFFLKRFGAYTSLEKGADTQYFSWILGLTTYVHKSVYLWYGLGLFSHYDTKSGSDWKSYRKETGIGINLYKNLIIRAGWSRTVGTTFTIGYRFLDKQKDKKPEGKKE